MLLGVNKIAAYLRRGLLGSNRGPLSGLAIPGYDRFDGVLKRCSQNRFAGGPQHKSEHASLVALFLAVAGLAIAAYLVSVRDSTHSHSKNKKEVSLMLQGNGIVNQPSNHSVDETVEKLEQILQAKGVTLFAVIDHSGEAEKAGMKMLPTKLLIFGSPTAGTPVMLVAPSIALDLPLKILVWEDGEGNVWTSYNRSDYLQERHGVPQQLVPTLAVVETLAIKASE